MPVVQMDRDLVSASVVVDGRQVVLEADERRVTVKVERRLSRIFDIEHPEVRRQKMRMELVGRSLGLLVVLHVRQKLLPALMSRPVRFAACEIGRLGRGRTQYRRYRRKWNWKVVDERRVGRTVLRLHVAYYRLRNPLGGI